LGVQARCLQWTTLPCWRATPEVSTQQLPNRYSPPANIARTTPHQALEHSPEVFGTVEMLYVVMEVNSKANNVPVKTFVGRRVPFGWSLA